jgi:small GTP-binding protein
MILAHLAWHEGDHQAALSHAQRVNSRDPAHGLATVMLGEMLLELKDIAQAEGLFRKALGADHDHQEARAMLGIARCHVHKQDWSGARQWAAQGLKLPDNNVVQAELLHTLGVAALAQGDAARALVEFQTAKQRAPSMAMDIEQDMARALNALRPDWSGLPTKLDDPVALSQTLTALRDYVARDTRLVDFLAPIQDMIDMINAPLSIAIVGEFNAGKSTLINALVGEDIVPMGVLPTTAHTGVIQYGPRQTARVHYVSGEVQEVGFVEAKRQMKTNAEDIDHLDYLYPHPQLRTVNFWDTPGFNALEARHEVVAQRALEQAEAILWMLDANQVLSQTEFDRIESVPQGNQRLLVLINKIDRLGPKGPQRDEAIEHLVEYVEDFAGEHIAGIFPVSALMALKGEEGGGVDAFRAHLQTQIIDRAGMIKTLEGRRHMTRVVVTLQAFGQGLLLRYEHLAQDVEDATHWLDRLRARHPQHEALNQLMQVEDRMDFMLQGVVKEVQEALTPKSTWINTKMVLSEEDRDFISTLLMERFDSVLEHSLQRVMADVASLEGEVAGHIGPVMQQLSLQDARAVSQRLDGFRDEVRVLKMLLQERVYGRLRARANGQIDAASSGAMESIALSADPTRWKGILRRLLPELRPGFQDTLEQWYADFFDAGDRVLEHLRRDLQLLKLEAKHRYDTSAVETLCGLGLEQEHEDEVM